MIQGIFLNLGILEGLGGLGFGIWGSGFKSPYLFTIPLDGFWWALGPCKVGSRKGKQSPDTSVTKDARTKT